MTLGIAFCSPLYVGIVTDGRLSGAADTDVHQKCAMVVMPVATLLFTFSGLAYVGRQLDTATWIADALIEASKDASSTDEVMVRVASATSTKLRGLRGVKSLDKALTVLFVGFEAQAGGSSAVIHLLSNYEEFGPATDKSPVRNAVTHQRVDVPRAKCHVLATGYSPAPSGLQPVMDLLVQGDVPATETVAAAVRLVRSHAGRLGESGRSPVGEECLSMVMAPGESDVQAQFYPSEATSIAFLPGYVNAMHGDFGAYVISNSMLSSSELTPPSGIGGYPTGAIKPAQNPTDVVAFPRVPRGNPCPCGSGKRYRNCHGNKG
jgi:SEC-C motif